MAGPVGSLEDDPISPHLVSSAFVQQYYHILHEQPEQVHKFYQDSSVLGRPEPNGTMGSVTTLTAINETIMSVDFRNFLIEIETADAQVSHKDGVLIIVTGLMTSSEGRVCRKFTQSFFLAPQESGGYFVLNDMLRFMPERQPAEVNQVITRENESCQIAISASETCSALPEPTAAEKSQNSDHVIVENDVMERKVIQTAIEYNVTTKPTVQVRKEDRKRATVAAPRDVTKKSYASIVKDMKAGPPAVPVARTNPSGPTQKPPKPVTKDVEVPVKSSAKPAQDNETPATDGIVAENNSLPNDNGYSVFIRNLPFYANIQSVEEEFKKFGAVKPGGVQVVHHKIDGFCFGFVEFESQQAMQAAIEASPICIGDNRVFIEKKRAPTRVTRSVYPRSHSDEGGRIQAGRGGHPSDNFGEQGSGYMNNGNYRGSNSFSHMNEGRENFNRRNDSGENYNRRNDSGENYNHRNDSGENYNRRNDGGENYNRRNAGGEKYNCRNDVGENYNLRNDVENYNRRIDGGANYNRRNDGGENYNGRNGGGENYNRRDDDGDNNRRGIIDENPNRRNDRGESYNYRGDGGDTNNRRGNMGENYNRRNDRGEKYNRRNDGGGNYNRRNVSGGENYKRTDGENFNRRNFRNQNEFSGSRGQGPPSGNEYHQNSNGFQPPRPIQNGNGKPARVSGAKQPPGSSA